MPEQLEHSTEAEVVRDLALDAAEPAPLPADASVVTVGPGGSAWLVEHDARESRPPRIMGMFEVADVDSLVKYVAAHRTTATELWANPSTRHITAVLNSNVANPSEGAIPDPTDADAGAGWGDHRAILRAEHTEQWLAWTVLDRTYMSQERFAEFLEDNVADLIEPTAAEMLELATNFTATTTARFSSARRLQSGTTTLVYEEDEKARAGAKGSVEIPQTFTVGLQPFHGAEAFTIRARLRYRINGGDLQLGYWLMRPGDVAREAFASMAEDASTALGLPVLMGTPAPAVSPEWFRSIHRIGGVECG